MYCPQSAVRGIIPLASVPTPKRREMDADRKSRRQMDRLMTSLGAMPQILCWNCRELTSFEVEQCEHCGSAFAGGTGGAYRGGRIPADRSVTASKKSVEPRTRSLSEIVSDLRHIRDLADPPRPPARRKADSLQAYQCPSCGRLVSESATACMCGVRFSSSAGSEVTFLCPECGASVPSAADLCPLCRVEFHGAGAAGDYVYACPRCGTHVASDAFRCSCGARFSD